MYELIALLATPIMWVLGLILLGLIFGLRQRRKKLYFLGRILIIAAGLALYLFSIPAISDRLLYSLESQYRQPDADVLSGLDILVVLGAGYHPSGALRESADPSGLAYARVCGGVKAFKNSGAGTIAFCEGWEEDARESGAEVMKALAIELGVQENKIITEDKSQNTMTNATELKRLLAPKEHRNIGLATSALHMPRAERVLRQVFVGDTIVPIPVGYIYTQKKRYLDNFIPSARNLQISTETLHEWIGMLWYTIRYSR
jgi:MYXO-CTERM domain-containing protein